MTCKAPLLRPGFQLSCFLAGPRETGTPKCPIFAAGAPGTPPRLGTASAGSPGQSLPAPRGGGGPPRALGLPALWTQAEAAAAEVLQKVWGGRDVFLSADVQQGRFAAILWAPCLHPVHTSVFLWSFENFC